MNVGIILSVGDGFKNQQKSGQLSRFVDYYLSRYSKSFDRVFVFEYEKEKTKKEMDSYNLPPNCYLISNKYSLHRYLYTLVMPLLNLKEFMQLDIFRVMQTTGGLPSLFAKLIYGKKYIVTFGFDYRAFARVEKQKLLSIVLEPILKIVLKYADKVILTNRKISKSISKNVKSKSIFIPNGVDVGKFKPSNKKISKKIKILFIGRLEKQKNLENLINAVSMVDENVVELTFIGGGSLSKKLIKLSREKKVNLVIKSPIAHKNLPSMMGQYDVFALVSLIEGHPKVLLEAMASGLPCLVSKAEGNTELAENGRNAMLCGYTSKEIGGALKTLLSSDKLRAKIATRARSFVVNNYNIEKLVDKEINEIKKLCRIN